MIQSKALKQPLYVLLWFIHDKRGEYKMRSYLPRHEIEAIVRTFYPSIAAFFETEEGNREFEKWKSKKTIEVIEKHKKVTTA